MLPNLSIRLARSFANAIRSWPFLLLFIGFTALWWGVLAKALNWSDWTTFLTEVDLIVYGVYQRKASRDDEQMQRNQLDTMKLILALTKEIVGDQDELMGKIAEVEEAVEGRHPTPPLVQEEPTC